MSTATKHGRNPNLDARRFAQRGELESAERAYGDALAADPQNPEALSFLGMRALERGDAGGSRALIEQALRSKGPDPLLLRNLAASCLALGDLAAARAAALHASTLDPRNAHNQLWLGLIAERADDLETAAHAYGRACAFDPRLAQLDPVEPVLTPWEAASGDKARSAMLRWLLARHERLIEEHGTDGGRAIDALYHYHGLKPQRWSHALQQPSFLFMPGLPARPWFERDEFDWIAEAEAAFDDVRAELDALLGHREQLRPYVDHSLSAHAGWEHLAGRDPWSAFHLLRSGLRTAAAEDLCPRTLALLERLPLPQCTGHAPEAFFSILKPGTHIPPHFGLSNFKVAVHLPLIVPTGCAIRVGGEERSWTQGRCIIFDDSFEHEAWNRGPTDRAVLIFEVWHPDLTPGERALVSAAVAAIDAFYKLRQADDSASAAASAPR